MLEKLKAAMDYIKTDKTKFNKDELAQFKRFVNSDDYDLIRDYFAMQAAIAYEQAGNETEDRMRACIIHAQFLLDLIKDLDSMRASPITPEVDGDSYQ